MNKTKRLVAIRGPLDVWLHPRKVWVMLQELGWAKFFGWEKPNDR